MDNKTFIEKYKSGLRFLDNMNDAIKLYMLTYDSCNFSETFEVSLWKDKDSETYYQTFNVCQEHESYFEDDGYSESETYYTETNIPFVQIVDKTEWLEWANKELAEVKRLNKPYMDAYADFVKGKNNGKNLPAGAGYDVDLIDYSEDENY